MSRMSINFDNEEQYNNFIQSIKDEVLKEVNQSPKHYHKPNNFNIYKKHITKRISVEAFSGKWNKILDREGYYEVFKAAFNKRTIWELNEVEYEKLENFDKELVALIDKYRDKEIEEDKEWEYRL